MKVGADIGGYRLERPLGGGPAGTIYQARHRLLGKAAAIRVVPPRLAADRETIARVFDDATEGAGLHHPGIATVLDFGFAVDGSAFLVTPLLEGEDLGSRLRRAGRLPPVAVARIGRQVASALHAAHDADLAHGAVEPGNIFLVPDPAVDGGERAVLVDFGIARLRGEPGDDIRGLGRLLFRALAGVELEEAGDGARVSHYGAPVELDRVVTRALAGDPRRRFPDAAAVAAALAALEPPSALETLAATPAPAAARAVAQPFTPPSRAEVGWWAGAAIAVVVALAAVGFYLSS
jgi:tRNA A-37 threonylcarbamoyl transferase component Bud32